MVHSQPDIVIDLHAIGKSYRIYTRPEDRLKQMFVRSRRKYFTEFDALREIDLTIRKGETVGILGCNGSGKSTMLQIICGTLAPTQGERLVVGRISALLELGAGFNPDFSGKENIYLNASILGLSRTETDAKYADIVKFSGLNEQHLAQPVKTYSSGMYVRLAFSVAIAVEPDILVVDEALAVGDEAFQRKCLARIKELQTSGMTILFVSHSVHMIQQLCDRAILLDAGELLMDGEPAPVINQYHRLIYAEREQRPAIHAAIKSGEYDKEPEENKEKSADGLAESAIEYDKNGAAISDVLVTDMDDKPVEILYPGNRYRYHYTVHFDEDASQVRFGMLIKGKTGLFLGGSSTEQAGQAIEKVSAGSTMRISFEFDCVLRAGSYFMNCGVSAIVDNTRIFMHRIIDACMFRVIEEKKTAEEGIVDFRITSTISVKESIGC